MYRRIAIGFGVALCAAVAVYVLWGRSSGHQRPKSVSTAGLIPTFFIDRNDEATLIVGSPDRSGVSHWDLLIPGVGRWRGQATVHSIDGGAEMLDARAPATRAYGDGTPAPTESVRLRGRIQPQRHDADVEIVIAQPSITRHLVTDPGNATQAQAVLTQVLTAIRSADTAALARLAAPELHSSPSGSPLPGAMPVDSVKALGPGRLVVLSSGNRAFVQPTSMVLRSGAKTTPFMTNVVLILHRGTWYLLGNGAPPGL